jgi:hypothetical protein
MAEFRIAVHLTSVMNAVPVINAQVFPLLNQAVRAVAQQTQINWMEAVHRAKLWSGERDAYAGSITWQMTGDFSAVVSASYKYAEEIETGRPPRDLKQMLNTSTKVRRTKDGRRFLIIPFRHSTPGHDAIGQSMPQYAYDLASQMTPSRVVGQSQRQSGEITSLHPQFGTRPMKRQTPFLSNPKTKSTFMVPKLHYKWGEKLPPIALASKDDARKYGNLYRFDAHTPGGKRYSTFMTFRVMMEGSPGWIVPAQPGLYLAKKVSDEMAPLATAAFCEAVKRTIG